MLTRLFYSAALATIAAIGMASPVRAQANGVPSIDGNWLGTYKSVVYDLTTDGAVDPKSKFKGEVALEIDQVDGGLSISVDFQPAPPGGFDSVTLLGTVGNFHLSMGNGLDDPPLVGSGTINRSATKITIRGVYGALNDTHEFVMKLKRAP
jgi:hypothetical protein